MIERQTKTRKQKHSWSHEVWLAVLNEQPVLLKSCTWGEPSMVALTLRRTFLKREASNLAWATANAPGIAPSVIEVSKDELVLERFTGPNFFASRLELPGQLDTFEQLRAKVNRLHSCGMAHGELRLGNIMWNVDELHLVDFATAVTRKNILFELVRLFDQMGLLWMKSNIFQLSLDSDEIRLQDKPRVLHKWFLKHIAVDIPLA